MDLQIYENWEAVRYLVGFMICVLSFACFKRKPKSFQDELVNELSTKKIQKIKKQALKLKEENNRANILLERIDKISNSKSFDILSSTLYDEEGLEETANGFIAQKTKLRQVLKSMNPNAESEQNLYEKVKRYAESGMDKELIHERTGLPMAEIDLILKIQRLTMMSQLKDGLENKTHAYG